MHGITISSDINGGVVVIILGTSVDGVSDLRVTNSIPILFNYECCFPLNWLSSSCCWSDLEIMD